MSLEMLKHQKVFIVGGSSGIGHQIAVQAAGHEADVIIGGRAGDKLDAAIKAAGGNTRAQAIDIMDSHLIEQAFTDLGAIDHLIITASAVRNGPIKELSVEDAMFTMQSKYWGAYQCAKAAQINQGGSITFFSGVYSRKPAAGMAALGAVNSALEALARGLAIEYAPIRVNTVSPGLIDSGAYDGMPLEQRLGMFEAVASSLPVGKIGQPENTADAALMLMTNPYITGITLDIDGGSMIGPV